MNKKLYKSNSNKMIAGVFAVLPNTSASTPR